MVTTFEALVMALRRMAGVAWGMRRAALALVLVWAAGWAPGPYAAAQMAGDLLLAWFVFWLIAQHRGGPAREFILLPPAGVVSR